MTDFRKTCNSLCGQGHTRMEEYVQEQKNLLTVLMGFWLVLMKAKAKAPLPPPEREINNSNINFHSLCVCIHITYNSISMYVLWVLSQHLFSSAPILFISFRFWKRKTSGAWVIKQKSGPSIIHVSVEVKPYVSCYIIMFLWLRSNELANYSSHKAASCLPFCLKCF
jgi:hypothetical protein